MHSTSATHYNLSETLDSNNYSSNDRREHRSQGRNPWNKLDNQKDNNNNNNNNNSNTIVIPDVISFDSPPSPTSNVEGMRIYYLI
jgi:hypothetical protein